LDVFAQEPLPASHPFWTTPNLYITPHCSADNLPQPSMQQIAHKIQQIEAGQTVTGIVDWTRGY
jgi:glyoxylate/hydroxypyruvate reductase A